MAKISINRLKRIANYAVLLLPLLILLPGLDGFAYPPQNSTYSDIAVSHYPNALFLRNSILEQHSIPLWSPTILSGYPFSADPLSGLWYPLGWLTLVLPLPFGFNLLVLLHLFFGGIGMWLLLKKEGLENPAALLGGIAFEAMPKLFAHFGAGHITLILSIAWTPWLLLYSANPDYGGTLLGDKTEKKKFRIALPGVIFALIILADVRWAAYAAILWWGYSLFQAYPSGRLSAVGRALSTLTYQILLGLMLAAPLLLPLLEYTRLSTRVDLTSADIMAFSLPPARLLGLFYPAFKGFHEWVLYPGITVMLLALLGVAWPKIGSATKFWLVAGCFSLVLSLGSNIPGISFLASIPGFNLLRVPSRMLFLAGISLAAVAAGNADRMLAGLSRSEFIRSGLVMASVVSFVVLLSVGIRLLTGSLPVSFAWGSGCALISFLWIEIFLEQRLSARLWLIGLFALIVIDLFMVDSSLFVIRSKESVLSEGESEAQAIVTLPGEFRVYSPSYSMPQQTSARYAIEMASGVDPLQLKSYASFMKKASGVPQNGYSVTVPPLEGDDPATANVQYVPDPRLLGLLNVGYVLSGFDLKVDGLKLVQRFNATWLYQNTLLRPRAWIQPLDAPIGEEISQVNNYESLPNRITLVADGPGLLVLSEIDYPGWSARVDNQPAGVQPVMGIFRSLVLTRGRHQVVFVYHPASVYIGLALSAISVCFLVGLAWSDRR